MSDPNDKKSFDIISYILTFLIYGFWFGLIIVTIDYIDWLAILILLIGILVMLSISYKGIMISKKRGDWLPLYIVFILITLNSFSIYSMGGTIENVYGIMFGVVLWVYSLYGTYMILKYRKNNNSTLEMI